MNTSDRGAWAEIVVSADLLSLGYHPFRAMSPAAPCDILILIGIIALRIEVRYISSSNGLYPMTTWHNSEKADYGAYVDINGLVAYSPHLPGSNYDAFRRGVSGIMIKKYEDTCLEAP